MLSADEIALRASVPRERVDRLADFGVIERDRDGRFDPGDVHRVRIVNAFEEAGVPLDALVAASRAGTISVAYYDELHEPVGPLSGRTYGEFAAGLGPAAEHLPRLFAAFGLAEPASDSPLERDDEALVAEIAEIVVGSGQPDIALRAVRLFGEAARRSAEGALGLYDEAVGRVGGGELAGLPPETTYELLFRPWSRFARRASGLAGWLTSRHMSRAIDEYSVGATEQVLEAAGFVAERLEAPPAVAFVDLTGFTRLTEERGDEAAAAVALRLGEVTADIAARRQGRVVKLLGDGVLVRFDDAETAVDATLDLLAAMPASGLPSGHAGVASGPLIARDGDVFGRTVNLAGRIADAAPDGRCYVTDALAAALPGGRYVLRPIEAAVLQGIGQVRLVDVARA